jgi:uncharacterized OsmC-like protein
MALFTFKATSKLLDHGMAVENSAACFMIIADEPKNMRGTDEGMNPVEMLLCALGSCQCITARFLAKSFGIDLKEYRVELEGDLDPAGFMKGMEGVRPGYQQIRTKVFIKANAPEEKQREFAAFVKSRCPVGDCLTKGVAVYETCFIVNGGESE